MRSVLKNIWPFLLAVLLFLGVSWIVQTHLAGLQSILLGRSITTGILVYVAFGIMTVIIPFGSLLPFMPIAVGLFGWQLTGMLNIVAWVLGSQILFELSRWLGRPAISRYIPEAELHKIANAVRGKGLAQALMVRMVAHGDIVSYAFGLFTDIGRFEFCLVTAIGVAPGAFVYAYFGSLPVAYQIGMVGLCLLLVCIYILLHLKRPALLGKFRL